MKIFIEAAASENLICTSFLICYALVPCCTVLKCEADFQTSNAVVKLLAGVRLR